MQVHLLFQIGVKSFEAEWDSQSLEGNVSKFDSLTNLVPRACDPREGTRGSGIIRCRKPGIVAKIELRIHFNGQSDSSLKRIIPEPRVPSRGSQARGTRLLPYIMSSYHWSIFKFLTISHQGVHCPPPPLSISVTKRFLVSVQVSNLNLQHNGMYT